jgi:hypothetical protein
LRDGPLGFFSPILRERQSVKLAHGLLAKLTYDKDSGGYVVTCRDLPEAITHGDTR